MITALHIVSQIEEALGDDRQSSFIRGKNSLDCGSYKSLDAEDCFKWTDREGKVFSLILEKIPVEPSLRVILRITENDDNEEFGYRLLNDYPVLPEVLLSYGRLVRAAKEVGTDGIDYPNEGVWEKLQPKEDRQLLGSMKS
jgi:hypothetical protein